MGSLGLRGGDDFDEGAGARRGPPRGTLRGESSFLRATTSSFELGGEIGLLLLERFDLIGGLLAGIPTKKLRNSNTVKA